MSRMFSAILIVASIAFIGYNLYDTLHGFMSTPIEVTTPDEISSDEIMFPNIDDVSHDTD